MAISVTMPALGESVTEGTVTRWLKQEGDEVGLEEPLLEVSTDKVDTEIPSPASGVLTQIVVREDEVAGVGSILAVIGGPVDDQPVAPAVTAAPTVQAASIAETPAPAASARISAAAPSSLPGGARPYTSPLIRRLARDHGVELASITGSGVGGRLRKSDVLAAVGELATAQAPADPPASEEQVPQALTTAGESRSAVPVDALPQSALRVPSPVGLAGAAAPVDGARREPASRMRQVIAGRMQQSLQGSAQLTAVVEVDVTKVARLRAQYNGAFKQRTGTKLTYLPFFAVAALEALGRYPLLNASLSTDAKTITHHDRRHLGIAVDTDRGLMVPTIRNAGDLNLGALAREIATVAGRARSGTITADELSGGTFTITNVGSAGVLFDTPIINPPQCAILFTGAIVKRPVVVDDPDLGDIVAVRSMCYLGLTYDHRLIDGADAGRYLTAVRQRVEGGAFEAALGG